MSDPKDVDKPDNRVWKRPPKLTESERLLKAASLFNKCLYEMQGELSVGVRCVIWFESDGPMLSDPAVPGVVHTSTTPHEKLSHYDLMLCVEGGNCDHCGDRVDPATGVFAHGAWVCDECWSEAERDELEYLKGAP